MVFLLPGISKRQKKITKPIKEKPVHAVMKKLCMVTARNKGKTNDLMRADRGIELVIRMMCLNALVDG